MDNHPFYMLLYDIQQIHLIEMQYSHLYHNIQPIYLNIRGVTVINQANQTYLNQPSSLHNDTLF